MLDRAQLCGRVAVRRVDNAGPGVHFLPVRRIECCRVREPHLPAGLVPAAELEIFVPQGFRSRPRYYHWDVDRCPFRVQVLVAKLIRYVPGINRRGRHAGRHCPVMSGQRQHVAAYPFGYVAARGVTLCRPACLRVIYRSMVGPLRSAHKAAYSGFPAASDQHRARTRIALDARENDPILPAPYLRQLSAARLHRAPLHPPFEVTDRQGNLGKVLSIFRVLFHRRPNVLEDRFCVLGIRRAEEHVLAVPV